MNILMKKLTSLSIKELSRSLSCTQSLATKEWRLSKGLPWNRMNSGPLTDKPDYTFLDGRPTPLLHKQKQRLLLQREFAEKIVNLNEQIDFAIQRENDMLAAKEEERQKIISNKLKPKGDNLFKKS